MGKPLPASFYQSQHVVELAKALIGKKLCTNINNTLTSGYISETEAYAGANDKASHAYGNKFTERTKTMFENGGVAYIYLCYGMHHLFNVVTGKKGTPHAVLIRAIKPIEGLELMAERCRTKSNNSLAQGPGRMSKALGITKADNAIALSGQRIWIEETHLQIPENEIYVGPRIGIDYAKEDKDLPYRFKWN